MARPETFTTKATRGLLLLTLVILVLGIDQFSKYLVRTYMELGQSIPSEGIVRLTYITNTGGAFGLFANQAFLLTLAAIIGVLIISLYIRYLSLNSTLLRAGLGLVLGGALGNLTDRLRFGEVIDFIDLGFWPVFNFADSAIVVGTVLVAYSLLLSTRKQS